MKYFLSILFAIIFPELLSGRFDDVHNGFGIDIGSNGSGVFILRQYTHNSEMFSLSGELRFYDIKASNETIVYDWYSNQYKSISGVSLVLIPTFFGANYYPFAGKIANNFSPFITFKSGPLLTVNGLESGKFIQRWSNAETHWSLGGFFGLGAELRLVNMTSVMFHIGYEFLPLSKDADGRKDYSGLLIHIAFNRLKR
tara:strand:+ start:860 stop:1453 length:594 start_codon:yes stop_codon:yes gene_type:complete